MNERGQIGGNLGGADDGLRVAPHVRGQPQTAGQLRDAAVLSRPGGAEPVQYLFRRHAVVLVDPDEVVAAGVPGENVVGDDVAVGVELHAVHK